MLSVICPYRDEEENLNLFYTRLKAILEVSGFGYEIIFINDVSKDDGPLIVEKLAKDNSRVIQRERLSHPDKGLAMLEGLKVAKGDRIAFIDVDLQVEPEMIPQFVRQLNDCDMVHGIRVQRKDSWVKNISSGIANGVRRFILNDHIVDIGCPITVFKKEVMKCYYPITGMHRFFSAIAEKKGFRIKQVEVTHYARRFGKSKSDILLRSIHGFVGLMKIQMYFRRSKDI